MSRPYFDHSIQQLEVEFAKHKSNLSIVRLIRAELDHRSRPRAARLRVIIDAHTRLSPVGSSEKPAHGSASRVSGSAGPSKPTSHNSPCSEGNSNPPPKQPQTPGQATHRPEQLLETWTALEVLSPATFVRPEDLAGGDRRCVARISDDSLPWVRGRRSLKDRRMYYQVVLGSIWMEPAVARLLERYGDSRFERPSARGRAALAVVILDSKGIPVASPAVAVSSFGWGVMAALNGCLTDLARWSEVEQALVHRLDALVRVPTKIEGEADRPVDWTVLMRGYEMLIREFGLPAELIEPPAFAICSYTYYRNPEPPEPLLLNSFFLGDLALARRLVISGQVPLTLDRYLGRQSPPTKRDVLRDEALLKEAISPKTTPLARWPGPGRHPLCLMQQAAVNLATRDLANGGLLGVNGPPGTGKTTLLRDVVAHVVSARAEAMCRFDDPEAAFTHSGERINVGGSAWLHLYRVCASLRGHEILVASSNNKAVENISKELPGLESISGDATGLRYFQLLADAAHERPTWGLVAAVLGNQKNRHRFRETFWWDRDVGLKSYLAAASGIPQQIEDRDPDTGAVTYRLPKLVAAESPPATRDEALARWRKARKQFRQALERSRDWQRRLATLEDDLSNLLGLVTAESDAARRHIASVDTAADRYRSLVSAQHSADGAAAALHEASVAMNVHLKERPGWIARLFRTPQARLWNELANEFRALVKEGESRLANARAVLARSQKDYEQAASEARQRRDEWEKACANRAAAEERIQSAKKDGALPIDEAFFKRSHSEKQQAAPWYPHEAQVARDAVFQSAMELHRAFIDASAKPLRHNLGVLMNVMGGRRLRSGAQEALLGDLWATLFLVVPLVSTTFASVERMLGRLPPESLGWLLIDEAGQAVPQSAVGALIRTRRAVVVGDPLQIEPVVPLPDALTRAICLQMGIDADRYSAPVASAQTLADAASPYASTFQAIYGNRAVGVPLLVHRRCSEPMFGIANAIAYGGLMVSAKAQGRSLIRKVLGPSSWLHVEGSSDDKWCEEEGAQVLAMLQKLSAAGIEPDLYIVTPFVIVADRLRRLVRESGVADGWASDSSRDWAAERIGTVHTVQGREAHAVIFVLGAPSAAQSGARSWAGGRLNLLNVAVTRAKEVLYVVGNRRLWRDAGVFRDLDAMLAQWERSDLERVREVERVQREQQRVQRDAALAAERLRRRQETERLEREQDRLKRDAERAAERSLSPEPTRQQAEAELEPAVEQKCQAADQAAREQVLVPIVRHRPTSLFDVDSDDTDIPPCSKPEENAGKQEKGGAGLRPRKRTRSLRAGAEGESPYWHNIVRAYEEDR